MDGRHPVAPPPLIFSSIPAGQSLGESHRLPSGQLLRGRCFLFANPSRDSQAVAWSTSAPVGGLLSALSPPYPAFQPLPSQCGPAVGQVSPENVSTLRWAAATPLPVRAESQPWEEGAPLFKFALSLGVPFHSLGILWSFLYPLILNS